MKDVILRIENLSKNFGENKVLSDINLEIKKGEIVGLVGENGAGKSTLMNIIFGMSVIRDTGGYSGKITFDGDVVNFRSPFDALEVGIGMVHQEFSLIPGFTASENILLNREITNKSFLEPIFGNRIRRINFDKIKEIAKTSIKHLGVDMSEDTKVSDMPVAHKQFTEIAREIAREKTKLIVLDEPTAVLTESEAELLLKTIRRLSKNGISFLFITHRLEEIINVCDKVVVLRDGVLINEVKTSNTNSTEITEWMIGRKMDESIKFESIKRNDETILEFKNLWVDMSGEFVRDVNLKVHKGEIFGLGGMAGQGKIGIANGVMGLFPAGGEVLFKNMPINLNHPSKPLENGIYFVSEDRKGVGLLLDSSIEENIAYPAMQVQNRFFKKFLGLIKILDKISIEKNAKDYIKKLEIRCVSSEQIVGQLSGGNQQKVCLAKAFTMNPEVLLVSEPTRGIDVGAKKLVLDTLKDFNRNSGTTIIIISSEIEELRSICDRIGIVSEGEIAGILKPTDNLIEYGKLMVGVSKEVRDSAE
ncbi:MAG: sugar ABC transporter ATP-binding protein [Fusobacteriaceae bacterium]